MSEPTDTREAVDAADASDGMLMSRRGLSIATALFTLAFGLVIATGATEFSIGWGERGPETGAFPFAVGALVAAASLATLVQALLDRDGAHVPIVTREQGRRAAQFTLPMLAFVATAHALGLYVAMAGYMFATMVWQGGYAAWRSALVALGTAGALFVMFDRWLKVPLAKGPLEALFGIH